MQSVPWVRKGSRDHPACKARAVALVLRAFRGLPVLQARKARREKRALWGLRAPRGLRGIRVPKVHRAVPVPKVRKALPVLRVLRESLEYVEIWDRRESPAVRDLLGQKEIPARSALWDLKVPADQEAI